MPHSREEVEAAFLHHRACVEALDWDAMVDCFTPDAVYLEHEMGTFRGQDAIRTWALEVMAPFDRAGWDYPLDWYVIEGDRVVTRWLNRLPNPDGRAEPYQFAGITVLEYAGDGRFSFQEDVYNMKECEQVMKEWFAAGGKL
jgi:ketosteroid isomerase-like protein